MIWLELCTAYRSSWYHHFHHPLLQWTPANPGSAGKWPIKRREFTLLLPIISIVHTVEDTKWPYLCCSAMIIKETVHIHILYLLNCTTLLTPKWRYDEDDWEVHTSAVTACRRPLYETLLLNRDTASAKLMPAGTFWMNLRCWLSTSSSTGTVNGPATCHSTQSHNLLPLPGRSGLAIACLTAAVRRPGIESRCGQLCLSQKPLWFTAVCTFPTVPRSTQPTNLRGTVNEYQLLGWSSLSVLTAISRWTWVSRCLLKQRMWKWWWQLLLSHHCHLLLLLSFSAE